MSAGGGGGGGGGGQCGVALTGCAIASAGGPREAEGPMFDSGVKLNPGD